MKDLTEDRPMHEEIVRVASDGAAQLIIPMNSNDIVLIKVKRAAENR